MGGTDALVVSLGGSPEPVKRAIESVAAPLVRFVVSRQSRQDAEALVDELALDDAAVIEVAPDDLGEIYAACRGCFESIRSVDPRARIAADYTGGTKTMSAGLVMAATDAGVELLITTGVRRDAEKVRVGEMTSPADASDIAARRQFETSVIPLVDAYAFGEAARLLRTAVAAHHVSNRRWWTESVALLDALDRWDRFDHAGALEAWPAGAKGWAKRAGLLDALERLAVVATGQGERRDLVGTEQVVDLLGNAERRAGSDRYDDAVGRVYRAMELVAQLRLEIHHGIDRSAPDGLVGAYEALVEQGDDVGVLWDERRHRVLDQLRVRNGSLLAHGTDPVDRSSWLTVRDCLVPFIDEVLGTFDRVPPRYQLPSGADLLQALPPPW